MSNPNLQSNNPGGPRRFYGKYRGRVVDNIDLLDLGRLLVDVPAVGAVGLEQSWALPCVPYAGPEVGLVLIPPIGANVWVEFEGGDPSHPIWVGCFWTEGEKPVVSLTPEQKVLQTEGTVLVIDDTPGEGGLRLEVGPPTLEVPVLISIDAEGIQISTAEAVVTMSPELISVTLPPVEVEITEEGIAVEAPDVNVTADVNVVGAVEIEGDVNITGAVEIEGNVEVAGPVEVEGNVEIAGAVEIEGNVEIAGAVEIEGNVEVAGAVEVEGDIALVGALEVVGDIAVAGAMEAAVSVAAPVLFGVPL